MFVVYVSTVLDNLVTSDLFWLIDFCQTPRAKANLNKNFLLKETLSLVCGNFGDFV